MNINKDNIRVYADRLRKSLPATAAISHAQSLQVFCRALYNRSYEECLALNFSEGAVMPAGSFAWVAESDIHDRVYLPEMESFLTTLAAQPWTQTEENEYECSYGGYTYRLCSIDDGMDIEFRIYRGQDECGTLEEKVQRDSVYGSWEIPNLQEQHRTPRSPSRYVNSKLISLTEDEVVAKIRAHLHAVGTDSSVGLRSSFRPEQVGSDGVFRRPGVVDFEIFNCRGKADGIADMCRQLAGREGWAPTETMNTRQAKKDGLHPVFNDGAQDRRCVCAVGVPMRVHQVFEEAQAVIVGKANGSTTKSEPTHTVKYVPAPADYKSVGPNIAADGAGYEAWLESEDTGLSSKYLARCLNAGKKVSVEQGRWTIKGVDAYPYDPDDFGRCCRMLRVCPELKAKLAAVTACMPAPWPQLGAAWTELESLYEQETNSEQGRKNRSSTQVFAAPKLYKRLQEIRAAAGVA
jgi:hypothetical protein